MNKKEIISTNQFVWMLFTIITSFTTLQILGMLIFHAGREAWLSAVVAWFLDVMLALVYGYMGIRFPGQNMMQYSITILGKFFGRIAALLFCFFFLMVASLLMRSIGMLIGNVILPNTPLQLIILTGFIFSGFAVKKGIETIARTCEVLGPIYLISLILLIIFIAPLVDINNLKPQLTHGVYPFLSGSIFILSYIGICIIMGMYIPICNHQENGFIAKFTAVSIGTFVISALVSLGVGVFGVEQAGNLVNVGWQLTRMIDIGDIIQRVEIIWMIIAIGAGIMTVTNMIWAASLGFSQTIGLSSHKPLVYPTILIAMVLSIISFDSNVELLNFAFYSYPFIGIIIESGLEIFLFITAILLKK
ncbi:MAG: GerAB/ArcD/ProY family transporter [Solirubrobacterales bacterium]